MNKIKWKKVVTREFSFLWASYTADVYKIMRKMAGTTLKYNLFYTEDRILTIYRDPADVENSYKLIDDLVKKNYKRALENMDLFESCMKDGYRLFAEIQKIGSDDKKRVSDLLLKLDKTFIKIIGYYLFVVFLGYGGNYKSSKKFIEDHTKQFERIRMCSMDADMNRQFPKLFGKYDERLREHALYMSRKELIDYVKGKKVDWNRVVARHKHALLIVKNNVGKEYPAEKIKKIISQELSHIKYDQGAKTIKGVVAFKGKVKGRVVKIMSKDEYKNIKEGDIVVTPMTKPDIIPYLRGVRGIITNDGGALSHASIISREMKIPCMVGTIYATDILKDNEEILLNADEGIIKRLSKKLHTL